MVASIPPLHALVAGVMDGHGKPQLLLRGGASPHAVNLKPSQRRLLADADALFWFGPALESFLARPAAQVAHSEALLASPALRQLLLPARRGGSWLEHHDHGHDVIRSVDPHVWLDPQVARALTGVIATRLAELDPANAARYHANAERQRRQLDALQQELSARLAPVRLRPYIVFHDAYQYFERRFGLSPVGAVSVDPARRAGARRVHELRAVIRASGARCVFAEPQFPAALLATLTGDGLDVKTATLDPLGATLTPGPDGYFRLLRGLAKNLLDCLH